MGFDFNLEFLALESVDVFWLTVPCDTDGSGRFID
jgi:hypothetical protein